MGPYDYPQYYPQVQQNMFGGYGRPSSPQNPQSGMELVQVQTVQQVEQVPVQPGQRRYIMVQNVPVIAARYADNVSGLTTTDYFRLEKFDPNAVPPQPEYITAEQLETRLAAFADSLPKPVAQTTKGKKGEQTE